MLEFRLKFLHKLLYCNSHALFFVQCYKMDASPCGICLIINNVDFEPASELKDRKGSNIDCDKMENRFKALNFEVIVKRNLKHIVSTVFPLLLTVNIAERQMANCP